MAILMTGCGVNSASNQGESNEFDYTVEKFADLEILRYEVENFDELSLQQKELVYYLTEAALHGRDILFDQNYKYNLPIRNLLETIYENYKGDRKSNDFLNFEIYLKRVWFSNGIHHHYSMDKFIPDFSEDYLRTIATSIEDSLYKLPEGISLETELARLCPIIFDPTIAPKRVNQAQGEDLIQTSACHYYEGLSQKEVEEFYAKMVEGKGDQLPSYGLNSTLVKENGQLIEEVWKLGGKYSDAIEKIIYWLEKAQKVAENEQQKQVIASLIDYYRTGDLVLFDDYSIKWVHDTDSRIDFVNGFIETYGDPLGIKASWESIVNYKDLKATHRTEIISSNAQWFEDHSPVDPRFKKEEVKGVSAKVITAAILAGDCYPATPIGINLPNANWIRQVHGSKSVTIENITRAYDKAAKQSGFGKEFMWSDEEIKMVDKYGFITDNLHTDLHECLGHGSGKMLPGVSQDTLKAYGATIEEARADLFGLYYMADSKLVELGLLPNNEAYKAEYYKYLMNGLMTQLVRIEKGKNVEEAHMRNRQMIAKWVYEKGQPDNVVELKKRDGKTYVVVNDYQKLRLLFGELLAEIQRIKSEGDFKAAQNIVENYGVKIDPTLHEEVLERYSKLNLSPYKGFVNPVYKASYNADGSFKNVTIDYTEGYAEQMLRYSHDYSHL